MTIFGTTVYSMSTILFILPFLVGYAILVIYAERKFFFAWIFFFIASLAESNRAPFDVGGLPLADMTTGGMWGIFWLISKTLFMVAIQIGVRWTFPRLRVDQLMTLGWKFLTPAALSLIIGIGCWKIFIA